MARVLNEKEVVDIQMPVYVVTSSNFYCEVYLDPYNFQFSVEAQVMECCSRVFEKLMGIAHPELEFKMFSDCQDQKPAWGSVMLTSIRGEDPNKAAIVFTHVVAANTGFYAESIKLQKELESQVAKINEAADLADKRKAKNDKDLQLFDGLKKKMLAAPPKKIKKKPINKKK